MSIEKITSVILSDAQQVVDAMQSETKTKCDAIMKEAAEKAAKIKEAAAANGLEEKEKLISRRQSVAKIDGRKLVLSEKQNLISECFDKAVEKIIGLPEDDYLNLMINILKNTGYLEGQLIFNEKDSKSLGEKVLNLTKENIPGSKFALSKEVRNIKGGFLLNNGCVYINGTIEGLVADAKEDLIAEVANELFQ